MSIYFKGKKIANVIAKQGEGTTFVKDGATSIQLDGNYDGSAVSVQGETINVKQLINQRKIPLTINVEENGKPIEVDELPTNAIEGAVYKTKNTLEGTKVPNDAYVEKVYFNKSLNVNQITNILSSLTYYQTPFLDDPIHPILFANDGSQIIFVTKSELDGEQLHCMYVTTDITNPEKANVVLNTGLHNGELAIISFNISEYEVNKSVISDYSGIPIGTENDKLTNLFSATPFEEETRYNAYSNGEFIEYIKPKGTIEVTENGEHDITQYEKVNVNIQSSGGSNLKPYLDLKKSAEKFFNSVATLTDEQLSQIIKYDDTENVTNMSYMFQYCSNLTSVPQLNTSKVTNMKSMFNACSKLTSVPQLNTSNVTSMNGMFIDCALLTTIPLLDTSKVTNMEGMFSRCSKLTSVPQLNTSNVTSMSNMFNSCISLQEVKMYGMKVAFDLSTSNMLSANALVEILNNLATITSTKTLTLGSKNLAKLTDEQKAIATNKGWTLA